MIEDPNQYSDVSKVIIILVIVLLIVACYIVGRRKLFRGQDRSGALDEPLLSAQSREIFEEYHRQLDVMENHYLNKAIVVVTPDDVSFPYRRKLLDCEAIACLQVLPDGSVPGPAFRAIQSLKQPNLAPNAKTPQGSRSDTVCVGIFVEESDARDACRIMAPPEWQSGDLAKTPCYICSKVGGVLNKNHHCRNCGYIACNDCSEKRWPGLMLPDTFHNDEKMVRVCDCCHSLMVTFAAALIEGDCNTAVAVYATGNVNVHNAIQIFGGASAYPVHYAAIGGNLPLLIWLIDDLDCLLYKEENDEPLLTSGGHSVLAVAALYGHTDVVKYLMTEAGMAVTEIGDSRILQLHLHMTTGQDAASLPEHLRPALNRGGPPPLSSKERKLCDRALVIANTGVRHILGALYHKQGRDANSIRKLICYNGSRDEMQQARLQWSEPYKVQDRKRR